MPTLQDGQAHPTFQQPLVPTIQAIMDGEMPLSLSYPLMEEAVSIPPLSVEVIGMVGVLSP